MPFLLTHPLAKGSGDVLQALPASRSSGISSALCFPAAHQAADSSCSTSNDSSEDARHALDP